MLNLVLLPLKINEYTIAIEVITRHIIIVVIIAGYCPANPLSDLCKKSDVVALSI